MTKPPALKTAALAEAVWIEPANTPATHGIATQVAAVTAVDEAEANELAAAEACVIPHTVAFVAPVLMNDEMPEAAASALDDNTLAAVEAVITEPVTSPPDERPLATVGVVNHAVIAVDADAVKADAANKPDDVPVPVENTLAPVGVAVHAVSALEPVANVDAAAREADVRFVTADAVTDRLALPP